MTLKIWSVFKVNHQGQVTDFEFSSLLGSGIKVLLDRLLVSRVTSILPRGCAERSSTIDSRRRLDQCIQGKASYAAKNTQFWILFVFAENKNRL